MSPGGVGTLPGGVGAVPGGPTGDMGTVPGAVGAVLVSDAAHFAGIGANCGL